MRSSAWFARFAGWTAHVTGHPLVFGGAVLSILLWLLMGPLFHYSDSWQLVINTSTTIVTFLMVFLIQNTQNREIYATQIKLDEIIRSLEGAHNALLDLEELTVEDIERLRARYVEIARHAREALRRGVLDTDRPDVRPD